MFNVITSQDGDAFIIATKPKLWMAIRVAKVSIKAIEKNRGPVPPWTDVYIKTPDEKELWPQDGWKPAQNM